MGAWALGGTASAQTAGHGLPTNLKATIQDSDQLFSGVNVVSFGGDARVLATANFDGRVRIYNTDPATGSISLNATSAAPNGFDPIWTVQVSKNSRVLAAGAGNGTVRLFDIDLAVSGALQPVATLTDATGLVLCSALSADGRLLAAGGDDNATRLYTVDIGHGSARLQSTLRAEPAASVVSLSLSENAQLLVTGSDSTVRTWLVDSGAAHVASAFPVPARLNSVTLSADGSLLAVGLRDNTTLVQPLDAVTGERVGQSISLDVGAVVSSTAFTSNGHTLAVGDLAGNVRLYSLARSGDTLSATLEATLSDTRGVISSVAMAAGATLLATGSTPADQGPRFDNKLRLYGAPDSLVV